MLCEGLGEGKTGSASEWTYGEGYVAVTGAKAVLVVEDF